MCSDPSLPLLSRRPVYGFAIRVAGNESLRWDEQPVDDPRQPAEAQIKPGPLQHGATGQDFDAEVAVARAGRDGKAE